MKRLLVGLMVLQGFCGVARARGLETDHDSLPPWIEYYNKLKGEAKIVPFYPDFNEPESLNVRLVGKWGRGPAARVTGRDSLVYVAMGSEVCVFNCVDASNPTVINEIQCRYVVDKAILKDTFLYAVLQGGVEVFNIANPRSVNRIKYLSISAVDLCIEESLAYTIDADSFKVYRLIRADSFARLGACADSGYYLAVNQGFGYACDRWGLYVIDATNPASPHQATILTGAQTGAAWVEGSYCYYTTASASPSTFRIANIADPYHPTEVGHINGISAYDLYKLSFFVYLPGYQIVDVSQPSSPAVVGSLAQGGNGVWTRGPYSHSFLAMLWNGMEVVGISDPVHPSPDTLVPGGDQATDICTSGANAYVADQLAGMKILDVTNPAVPSQVGEYDTTDLASGINGAQANAVATLDSIACISTELWSPFALRVLGVSQPQIPRLLGGCLTWNPGKTVVLRDTLIFVAENAHFEVFSVTNPHNPLLVGSCGLPNSPWDMAVVDTLVYVTTLPTKIVNIRDPTHPFVTGTISTGDAYGIAVSDTVALIGGEFKLDAVSIADPAAPRVLSSLALPGEACYGVAIDGPTAWVGTAKTMTTSKLHVLDISDPSAMREIGNYVAPAPVLRVRLQDGRAFAACYDAGVCIFETTATVSIGEGRLTRQGEQTIRVAPNPASSYLTIRREVMQGTERRIEVRDALGRTALNVPIVQTRGQRFLFQRVDISALPEGCYFIRIEPAAAEQTEKVVKTKRR